jgi:tetratricopeptide (TPR) repeat protein
MTNTSDNKLKANELRKKGDIKAALPIYKELWEISQDKFDIAGLIFCYRKLKDFNKAIPLAMEAYSKFASFDWCRNEYIWTLIQGKLYTFPDDGELSELLSIVEDIINAKPDEIAYKITVFKLLKFAKKNNHWDILNIWITKIDPKILDGYKDETSGWTDKELWFYYRVNGLIYSHKEVDAIKIIEDNKNDIYKQNKFFERLKAKAFINLGNLEEAEKIYNTLASKKTDWWLIHEYGNLLLKRNKPEDALISLINAAQTPPMKLELKVSLFSDIGNLLISLNKNDFALPHLLLSKAVREEKGWSVGNLRDKIVQINKDYKDEKIEIKVLLNNCKDVWKEFVEEKNNDVNEPKQTRNLKGKISNLNKDKAFCFIKTKDNQSFFCFKSDLPIGTTTDHILKFDIKQTIDRKKNTTSFKAFNISISK